MLPQCQAIVGTGRTRPHSNWARGRGQDDVLQVQPCLSTRGEHGRAAHQARTYFSACRNSSTLAKYGPCDVYVVPGHDDQLRHTARQPAHCPDSVPDEEIILAGDVLTLGAVQ